MPEASKAKSTEDIVAEFVADVKQNPSSYDQVRRQLRNFLLQEKLVVEEAIEDVLDLRDSLEEEPTNERVNCEREIAWIEQDLMMARQSIGKPNFRYGYG
jgi:hypothetical protein